MSKEERIARLEESIELVLQSNRDLLNKMSGIIRREAILVERIKELETNIPPNRDK